MRKVESELPTLIGEGLQGRLSVLGGTCGVTVCSVLGMVYVSWGPSQHFESLSLQTTQSQMSDIRPKPSPQGTAEGRSKCSTVEETTERPRFLFFFF